MKTTALVFLLLLSSFAQAGAKSDQENKLYIRWIETGWSKDGIVINFDRVITYSDTAPNCNWGSSVYVSKNNNAMMDQILSIALAAQMANKPVAIYVSDVCAGNRAELISIQIWRE
ncbi:hypothetical protein ACJJH9_05600 [Microbulbifer sp. DLAB2-AF]|uniref:hypothetical protein n=1 Tax=Microbulbifer sp. DLAB2-AF TaxID=3243395 RepID=UPI0040393506